MATAGQRGDEIVAADRRDVLPLTAAQRGMWFAETLSPDYSVNIAQYVDIRHEPGGLDYALLEQCVYEVGKASEFGYVRLAEVDGVPVQYVDLEYDQHVDVIDFRAHADPEAAAMTWMKAEYRRPVDLLTDQFIVISILKISDERTFWYNRTHHIILDGYAALSIMRRTVDRYNAIRRGQEPKEKPSADMAEIVEYEESYQRSSRRETDREHWLRRVADLPERVTLAQSASTAPLSFDNKVAGEELRPALQSALEELATELNSSIAVLLTSAFGAFLSRMTGTDDIVMSLPVTGRATAKIKASGGMVSNVLPIRLRGVQSRTVRELVRDAQLELTGALRHQRYRSDDIRRDAGLDGGSVSFGPTINMVFFDNEVAIDGTTMEYRILSSGILEDLLINLYQSSPGAPLVVDLHGNPNLYTDEQMAAHHRRFARFLERFIGDVDVRVDDIDLLLPGEQDGLLAVGRGADVEFAVPRRGVLGEFEARVDEDPSRTAVVFDDTAWSYGELDRLRNSLAHQLIADGAGPGDRIVVALDRGFRQVCAIYAVLGAGAAYVPVDPAFPDERKKYIVDTARPSLIIDDAYLERVGFADRAGVPDRSASRITLSPSGDASAYVIFTSGSTGMPKGVEVGTAAIVNRMDWMQRNYPLAAADGVLYKTPFTFDVSVWELLWPLQIGARMIIARPGGHRDPEYLAELIRAQRVSVFHFVPSMLHAYVDVTLLDGTKELFPEFVRRIFVSGEAIGRQLADKVLDHSAAELVNLYGPTEAAVDITEHVVDRRATVVPIGRPVANSHVYVLDPALRPVPTGVAGELYLAGCQLAFGYVSRPELTANRFVADLYGQPGGRMYRTGDLVRWNEDGEIEYLGRSDFQIKIRGQRVELGEIETVITEMPEVEGAVVIAQTEASAAPRLVAYLTSGGGEISLNSVIEWCRRRLPSHMVPAAVVVLEHFPVNNSGKLDRAALPAPTLVWSDDTPYVAPTSPLEIEVVALISELLGAERIGLRDNIFTLGADSLVAARLVSRLRRLTGLEVTLADVFDSPTIEDLIDAAKPVDGFGRQRPDLSAVTRPDRIPLSAPQTRLWFINRLDPTLGAYNIPGAVRLGPDVDVDAIRDAVHDVAVRHEPLRTTFPDDDGDTYQLIHPVDAIASADLFVIEDVPAGDIDRRIRAISALGFDLATELPLRVRLLRSVDAQGAVDHVLVLVMHHIVSDGASLGPLITDVLTAYAARAQRTEPQWSPLPVQYADFTLWQREVLGDESDEGSAAGQQLTFWRNELQGMPELIALPADRPRPTNRDGAGEYLDLVLGADSVQRLRMLAAEHGVTMFAVFHAALTVVLARVSGGTDIAVGTAVAGRDEMELADLVGMFVNTLVLRTRVNPDDDLSTLLHSVHHTRAQALSNADVPFEQVVSAVGARRSRSHSPLFQVELVMQHDQVMRRLGDEAGIELIDARPPFAKYDLSLSIIEFADTGRNANEIGLSFSYATDLFDRSTIERFSGHFQQVLSTMCDSVPGLEPTVDELFRFPEAELATVQGWSAGPDVESHGTVLPDLFFDDYAADPDLTALVFGSRQVTYGEFGARVHQLARQLISLGIGPDSAVAVCIPRSVELLVAVHAVIVAGGQYVPVDTQTPLDRGEYMAETAGVSAVLVGRGEAPAVVAGLADRLPVVHVDASVDVDPRTPPVADAERLAVLRPEHAAYTIFTSGSTGQPKGVTVSHRAIINRLDWMQRHYHLAPTDVVLQKTPITFDVSVWELFWPFSVGASLAIAEHGRHGDPRYLADLIERESVSTLHFVPSMLSAFVDVLGPAHVAALRSIRHLFTSGEALAAATAQAVLASLPTVGLHNLYGPTEAAVDVTEYQVHQSDTVIPIGAPVQNTTTHVLDQHLRPLPAGVPGELYLGGIQLSRGYASRPRLTAERFVADPLGAPGDRLYRTGDLARWNSAGEIEYLGRNDFQVKLRGQRLELGEIESALMAVPGVVHAAATVADLAGGQSLVAYYSPASVAPETVRAHVVEHLPEFMVPSIWMPLESMPVSSAGKVDRRALPEPVLTTAPFVGPRTEVEAVIAGVYADVLGVDRVSVVESFFDLGGNSLSATKVAARLSAELNVEVPVVALFDAPSVEAMAELAGQMDTPHRRPPLVPAERGATAPLSSVQRSMWLLNRADPASPVYNLAMALRLSGDLDRSVIQRAIEDLIDRHESLRTRYPMVDGQPVQLVLDTAEALALIERPIVDVSGRDPEAVIAEFTQRGFDVTVAPPLRMVLLAVAPGEHILVFVVHHISADGSSMLPLAADIMTAYSARVHDTEPGWRPLEVQYADYAVWQRGWLDTVAADDVSEEKRQLGYWVSRLANAPAKLELPSDRVRPRTPSFAGGEVTFEVDAELARKLDAVARHNNATVFMVMQAALVVLLSRLTAQHDIVVGTPFAGRSQPQLEGVIGMFVNTLALRTQLHDDEKFAELLQRVRDDDLTDMANADVPFDTIVASVLQSPPISYNPIYQVMFAYQNFTVPTLDLENLTITPVSEQLITAKVDLQLTVFPGDSGGFAATGDGSMRGQLIYAADLFTQNTVELYAKRYLRVLEEVSDNPHVLVGDISIATESEAADQRSGVQSPNGHQQLALPELVRLAASAVPDRVATSHNGTDVTFAVLSSISEAMVGTLPDADSALTTALMSLIPEVAASGPDTLGEVLGQLRVNALTAAGESKTPTSEGMTQT
ncbi:amino acid adenylation domain-containing protein [Jongsikchunia kroppenstedtii]|uniref:amino acid adenylation domain-containing protein n=1 Tax=Jongsikchunia kroppenstedtii TaxID=1121721 RepID=UPI0009DA2BD7|nr:non-ribosomal peptide synthetase [Jongsikchunia kroppenstedtii]